MTPGSPNYEIFFHVTVATEKLTWMRFMTELLSLRMFYVANKECDDCWWSNHSYSQETEEIAEHDIGLWDFLRNQNLLHPTHQTRLFSCTVQKTLQMSAQSWHADMNIILIFKKLQHILLSNPKKVVITDSVTVTARWGKWCTVWIHRLR